MGRLSGRVVMVTGAGRGLGRTVALHLAGEGAAVALAGRSAEQLAAPVAEIQGAGGRAAAVLLDVRDPDGVAEAVRSAEDALGPLDGLVANSGIAGPTAPIWEVGAADWSDTIDVNLTGAFLCCREVLGGMVERRRGSVVVVGSMTGKRPLAGRTPYAASKLGLVGLVRTAAVDAGPYGVRVNLVSPGPIEGERLRQVIAAQARARGVPEAQATADLLGAAPLGRAVTEQEVAASISFLLSDEAAATTGEDLNVSAGLVCH